MADGAVDVVGCATPTQTMSLAFRKKLGPWPLRISLTLTLSTGTDSASPDAADDEKLRVLEPRLRIAGGD